MFDWRISSAIALGLTNSATLLPDHLSHVRT